MKAGLLSSSLNVSSRSGIEEDPRHVLDTNATTRRLAASPDAATLNCPVRLAGARSRSVRLPRLLALAQHDQHHA